MSEPARLDLELLSDPSGLPDTRLRVRRWVLSRGWSDKQAEEIVLALDEALANVIRHGYGGDPRQQILLSGEAVRDPREGEGVEIRVRDFGRQVDPATICGRELGNVRPGGLGVHLIRAMTNSVEFRRAEGGGMLLIMRKYKTHTVPAGQCDARQP